MTQIKPYSPFQEWIGSVLIKNAGNMQVWLYETSKGKLANTFLGAPVAILTTTGRKSGKTRKAPVLFLEDGERVLIAATKGGMSKPPIWYLNIVANPDVAIQIGARKRNMRVREADENEQAVLWPKLEAMYAGFVEYRERLAGVRNAPLLILEESAP